MPEQKAPSGSSDSWKGDRWLAALVASASPVSSEPAEIGLIRALLDVIYSKDLIEASRRTLLAAAFDLVVAAEYYSRVAHVGWVYCPDPADSPTIFYPYTNVCPRCVLRGKFVYHKANKPRSGTIGAQAARLLLIFLQELLARKRSGVRVLKGAEPVDAVFVDRSVTPPAVMFAEIKAAPLVTLPLAAGSQPLTVETERGARPSDHRETDFSQLFGASMDLLLPVYNPEIQSWLGRKYILGEKRDEQDTDWAFRALRDLIERDPSFLEAYFRFWEAALHDYGERSRSAIYWLTNACGHPRPRPDDWPRRRTGKGFESVSDSKTSAGMDRTDDLKKATYQALKLGADGKPSRTFAYKVGIISNIHAVRHFEEYLASLKDIIWTRDETGEVTRAGELPPETKLFNLFDGIIALTEIIARDSWVRSTFDF